MPDTITPRELSKQIGVTERTIRQFLRETFDHVHYSRWNLTEVEADVVRERFAK